jgi:hypothetical protein
MYELARQWPLATYFPEALPIAEVLFVSLGTIVDAFGAAGLRSIDHQEIEQRWVATSRELLARARLRADSLLARMPDRDFETGLARLANAVDRHVIPDAPAELLDLVVFE